ncbi:MAG: hypothetical protein ACREYD_11300, partial [Casimicrobiaceae bacterium]
VDELRWRGPGSGFAEWAERIEAPRLLERCRKVLAAREPGAARPAAAKRSRKARDPRDAGAATAAAAKRTRKAR